MLPDTKLKKQVLESGAEVTGKYDEKKIYFRTIEVDLADLARFRYGEWKCRLPIYS